MNERLKELLRAEMRVEMDAFKLAHPDWASWTDDVKLARVGLWLQERYADSPKAVLQYHEDRQLAKRLLLLE
jgi:hypothetical protein